MKTYINETVLEAACQRISTLFDNFTDINVSMSSGKDSTVLLNLCIQEAERRGRRITALFVDQEAEYDATIDVIRHYMQHPVIIPAWYQVPMYMTNATSYSEYFLYAWGPGEEWMRDKDDLAIHKIDEQYPKRFYKFFPWYEQKNPQAAYLVGLRADEGLTRYRAVTKNPGWNGYPWATTSDYGYVFYPIYDWTIYDVWKFIYDYDLKYNRIYDLMYFNGQSIYNGMRISNLVHEKSYKCLTDLARFEPDTYDRLCRRIGGIATAARYAAEKQVFNNKVLPSHYNNWKEFRDFLLANIPESEHRKRFEQRFAKQPCNEQMYQQQVGQLLINDYEGNVAVDTKKEQKRQEVREKWKKIL